MENANILILGALVLTRPENFQLPTIILTINIAITPFTLHFKRYVIIQYPFGCIMALLAFFLGVCFFCSLHLYTLPNGQIPLTHSLTHSLTHFYS